MPEAHFEHFWDFVVGSREMYSPGRHWKEQSRGVIRVGEGDEQFWGVMRPLRLLFEHGVNSEV